MELHPRAVETGRVIRFSFIAPLRRLFAGFACALALASAARGATEILAAGDNYNGESTVPAGLVDAIAVAAGDYHSLALRSDGSVVGWGASGGGRTTAPTGVGAFLAIAAGQNHSVGLTADQLVHVWGDNAATTLAPPPGLAGVTAIATSNSHVLALKSDGTVVAWGENWSGETSVPAGLNGVIAIATNSANSVAVQADGSVVVWGSPTTTIATGIPPALSGVVAVSLGNYHAVARKADGTVVAWGDNWSGQATVPAGLAGVVAVAASNDYSIALKADGTAVAWGAAYSGQTNFVPGLVDGLAVAVAQNHALALRSRANDAGPAFTLQPVSSAVNEGDVASFTVTATGHPTPTFRWQHRRVGAPDWSDLADGDGYAGTSTATLAITTRLELLDENVRCVATNGAGAATSATATVSFQTKPVITPASRRHLVDVGQNRTLSATVSTSTGETPVLQWKFNGRILPGATSAAYTITAFNPRRDAGCYQLLATDSRGTRACPIFVLPAPAATTGLRTWGEPAFTAFPADRATFVALAAVEQRAFAVRADGTVAVWGTIYPIHQPPAGLTDVVALGAGTYHAVALRADGTVVSWGVPDYAAPATVATLRDVVAIAVGSLHTLALRADGSVVAFGDNSNGAATVPPGLADVVGVAAGFYHSLAVKSDGTVAAWGSNFAGQLSVPVAATNVKAVAAGYNQSLALKLDGSVVGWGQNATPPSRLDDVVALVAGERHSLALRGDGTVTGWGDNGSGQTAPPAGLADVVALAAGTADSLALTFSPTTTPIIVTPPANASTREGKPVDFAIAASGTPAPGYAWQRKQSGTFFWAALANGADFSGVDTATLHVLAPTTLMTGDSFRCVVSNNQGTVTSPAAVLTVTSSFATFVRLNFTVAERAVPAVSGVAADPDGDGLNNLLEYAFGRNPKLAEAGRPESFTLAAGYLVVSFPLPNDAADLDLFADESTDLVTWSDVSDDFEFVDSVPVSASVSRITVREPAPAGSPYFLRLRAVLK